MVKSCSAVGCSNRHKSGSGITFHRFPADPSLLSKWLQAVKRLDPDTKKLWKPSKFDCLCSHHFRPDEFYKSKHGTLTLLKKEAVPSIFCWSNSREVSHRTTLNSKNSLEEPLETCTGTATCKSTKVTVTKDHSYFCDPNSLKRKYDDLLKELETTKKDLYNSRKREKRSKNSLEMVLNDLKNSKELNEKASQMLDTYKDIPVDILKRPSSEYSSEQRQFATTLFFYCPKAYRFVRESLNLPHPSTVRSGIAGKMSDKKLEL